MPKVSQLSKKDGEKPQPTKAGSKQSTNPDGSGKQPKDLLEGIPSKLARELLIGDTVHEVAIVKRKERLFTYKVTAVNFAACTPYKIHVTIDGNRNWCYDIGAEVHYK